MMINHPAAAAQQAAPGMSPDEPVTVETRFGVFEFTAENSIFMPTGPHGFTGFRRFGLANLPEPAPEHFKLLQSLEDALLSFIVLPLEAEAGTFAPEDLEDGATSVGIPMEDATFLLIVTLRVTDQGTMATANLRAPIVLDLKRRIARQVVLADNRYPIRQPL